MLPPVQLGASFDRCVAAIVQSGLTLAHNAARNGSLAAFKFVATLSEDVTTFERSLKVGAGAAAACLRCWLSFLRSFATTRLLAAPLAQAHVVRRRSFRSTRTLRYTTPLTTGSSRFRATSSSWAWIPRWRTR
jgi:hypothetical protein